MPIKQFQRDPLHKLLRLSLPRPGARNAKMRTQFSCTKDPTRGGNLWVPSGRLSQIMQTTSLELFEVPVGNHVPSCLFLSWLNGTRKFASQHLLTPDLAVSCLFSATPVRFLWRGVGGGCNSVLLPCVHSNTLLMLLCNIFLK